MLENSLELGAWMLELSPMALPDFLQPHANGCYLRVKVQPRASKNEIGDALGGELKIKVTAPPVDAAANQALLDLLAEELDCPRNTVQLVRGQTSRHKTIFIVGKTPEEIARLLNR